MPWRVGFVPKHKFFAIIFLLRLVSEQILSNYLRPKLFCCGAITENFMI
jgi:hypothetical protein